MQDPWISQASERINIYHRPIPTAKNFFDDSPWLNIPSYRKADILVKPLFPRLGLLGGSSAGEGKMSKIAALAAKRRQKENEKQQVPTANNDFSCKDSTPSLDKLKIATKTTTDSLKARALQPRRRIESNPQPKEVIESSVQMSYRLLEPEDTERAARIDEPENTLSNVDPTELRATPSAFARILMDCHDRGSSFPSQPSDFLLEPVVSAFDFSKPSPDDVVLRARNFKGPR
jgi:elongation factor 1 alpha-like protein